jgi:hypothetical protein
MERATKLLFNKRASRPMPILTINAMTGLYRWVSGTNLIKLPNSKMRSRVYSHLDNNFETGLNYDMQLTLSTRAILTDSKCVDWPQLEGPNSAMNAFVEMLQHLKCCNSWTKAFIGANWPMGMALFLRFRIPWERYWGQLQDKNIAFAFALPLAGRSLKLTNGTNWR